MELRIEIVGAIVERQELLNGTQMVTIEGADGGGRWTFAGTLSWNLGLVDYAGEGDLTVARADGAEIFGTLTWARVTEVGDSTEADHAFHIEYEIDGGAGGLDGAAGEAEATGSLGGDGFQALLVVKLSSH